MKQSVAINEQLEEVFNTLCNYYGDSILKKGWHGNGSWWQAESAIEIMVGSILVQNTNWNNVDKALKSFGENLNPPYILRLSNEELAAVIRPAGFQNQKAKKLKFLFEWFEQYNFDVECVSKVDKVILRKELLAINGVGHETADALLVYVFNKTSFVIDAYARRIFSRLGFNVPKQYDAFQKLIEDIIPRNVSTYDYYHGLIVEHAKEYCNKIPKCDGCPVVKYCGKVGIND